MGSRPKKDLLQDRPAGGPRLVWDVTGVGNGYSTVATAGDRIVTAGELEGRSSVICLNAKDGSRVWAKPIGKAGTPACCNAGGPRSTPTIDTAAGLVFAISQHGEVAALNWKDGKEVWKKDLIRDYGGRLPEWGYSAAAVIDGDNVIMTPGSAQGTVISLKKKTGETVWETKDLTDTAHYSTAILATISGSRSFSLPTKRSPASMLRMEKSFGARIGPATPLSFQLLLYSITWFTSRLVTEPGAVASK